MSETIEGIAFSVKQLRKDADEIEGCGGGNEAACMRWAADRISALEKGLDSCTRRDKWNFFEATDHQRQSIRERLLY